MPRKPLASELPTFVPVPADGVYTRAWLDAFFAGDQAGFVEDLRAVAASLLLPDSHTTTESERDDHAPKSA